MMAFSRIELCDDQHDLCVSADPQRRPKRTHVAITDKVRIEFTAKVNPYSRHIHNTIVTDDSSLMRRNFILMVDDDEVIRPPPARGSFQSKKNQIPRE